MNDFAPIELPIELTDVPITDFASTVTALPLSEEEHRVVASVFDFINDQAPDTFLGRVEAAIEVEKAAPAAPADNHELLRRRALRVWWYFGQALEAGGARRLEEAERCYRKAAYGFARLGDAERLEEAAFQVSYTQALELIRQQRIPEGMERLAQARQLLESGSSMGTQQREMLAALEIEVMLQQSTAAFAGGNQVQAEQLRRRAAELADGVAAGHGDADPAGRMWRGQAGLLRAQADLMAALSAIALYNFDRIVEKGSSVAARQAAGLLAETSPANGATATYFAELLAVLEDLAAVMLRVLSSTFHREHGEFRALRARVMAARKAIPAAAGLDAIRLVEACDQVDQWLNNLERLAKPTKKDLGVYGGFVACVVFCALLLVIAVVNRAFDLGASATQIFAACTTLAVLAGFGLTGLKVLQGGGSSAAGSA